MLNAPKILLVDDDPIFLKLAKLSIKKEDESVEIFTSTNGEEALQFLHSSKVDIIYLDLNMPVMNGWEFLDEISKKETKHPSIFILTSSIDPTDRRKAKDHPMVAHMLQKPLDASKIHKSIALGKSSSCVGNS